MIVPRFWAEGRVSQKEKDRQVTVRRFGWSNTSVEDAQQQADLRAREAFDRVWAGETLPRREPKRAYNGADGVPIREEIVSEHGPVIITRNSYGALCLNTPDALFADVDFEEAKSSKPRGAWVVATILVAGGIGLAFRSVTAGILALAFLPLIFSYVRKLRPKPPVTSPDGPELPAMKRIRDFVTSHPDWKVRVYRTPAGLRVLALHRRFTPNDADAQAFFNAIGSDPLYVLMCVNQQCFRARVSPKPWRIKLSHRRLRVGIWPVSPERVAERREWVAAYDQAAKGYASCHLIETIGHGAADDSIREVQELHDSLSRATATLPLA